MKTDLFDYTLPDELIALHPPVERDGGRLLVLPLGEETPVHGLVRELPERLASGTLLVLNDTKVIPARLRGKRPTGGAVEVLLVRALAEESEHAIWTALLRAGGPIRVGDRIDVHGVRATVEERGGRGEARLRFDVGAVELRRLVQAMGEVPLPPYIRRDLEPEDQLRYQTVFARCDGSVAAPTASLHFTASMLERLRARGVELVTVTLHVGPGTFRPISADDTTEHVMDAEAYTIDEPAAAAINQAKAQGRPVLAVGTTVTRALEGAFARCGQLRADEGDTSIFIEPGFEFRVIDGLLTNFHLPRSTLLCLVSALVGRERLLAAYAEAVARRYRFYSYGDAMLLAPRRALAAAEGT